MTRTTTPTLHKNLEPTREMVTHLVTEIHSPAIENAEVIKPLDGGDDYELIPLPGDSLEAISDITKGFDTTGVNFRTVEAAQRAHSGSYATVLPGARHTTSEAVYLPVSKVFSCPKFMVLDVGNAYPQGRRHRFGDVSKPHVHSADLDSQRMVFVTPEGANTMTTVNTIPTPTTGNPGNLPTHPAFTKIGHIIRDRVAISPSPKVDPLARQQAIENALSMALWHIRKDSSTAASIQRATGRAVR